MNVAQASKVRLATGRVAKLSTQPDRYAVLVGTEWYSAFEKVCPVSEGQNVAIAYVEKGRFRNIVAVEVLETPTAKLSDTVPGGFQPSEREQFVARCVALKSASTLHSGQDVEKSWMHLTKEAEILVRWLLGKGSSNTRQDVSMQANEPKAGEGKPPSPIYGKQGNSKEVRAW